MLEVCLVHKVICGVIAPVRVGTRLTSKTPEAKDCMGRIQETRNERDNVGPVCSLKFVALLVALSPELLFLGAGVQLRDNGYDGLLVAINPQVSEDQNLIANIKASDCEEQWTLLVGRPGPWLDKDDRSLTETSGFGDWHSVDDI
ncbi:hypothetical protein CB1_001326003 [Camelus ferus]|nr:hypothetical protein CB1_001326003 [Camelus ferus]